MHEDILGLVRRWLVTSAVVGFAAVPRLRSNPEPAYRALRLLDPTHESPTGIWVLSRHREVNAALRNSQLGSDEMKADLAAIKLGPLRGLLGSTLRKADGDRVEDRGRPAAGASGRSFRELMLFRDPPDHARLRSLVSKAFTPRAVDALEERITELTHRQLDGELIGAPSRDHELIMRNCSPCCATPRSGSACAMTLMWTEARWRN
jgi:cytochrome P450